MKLLLIVIVIFFSVSSCFAKATLAEESPRDSLLHVKKLIEKELSGSDIRDINVGFVIERDRGFGTYTFSIQFIKLIQPSKIENVQEALRKYLSVENNHLFNGILYFDKFSDRVIVDIWPRTELRIDECGLGRFDPSPSDGVSDFTRRFHDYINVQIEKNNIAKDEAMRIVTMNFFVCMDGSLVPGDNGILGGIINDFLVKEKPWWQSIKSDIGKEFMIKVTMNLAHDYIGTNHPWRVIHEWANYDFLGLRLNKNIAPFYTTTKPNLLGDQNVVSFIYDDLLNTYRMPLVHSGSYEGTRILIEDILQKRGAAMLGMGGAQSYRRIYFYR